MKLENEVLQASRRSFRILTVSLGVIAVLLILWRANVDRTASQSSSSEGPIDYGRLVDFDLVERSGRPLRLADLGGKVWIADFIFTRCSGPCPLITSRMALLQKQFFQDPRVRFVSFSVDPEHDSPPVLAKYADTYGADPERWYFLTGETEQVHNVVMNGFHLAMEPSAEAGRNPGEAVNHSLYFVLVDQHGRIRGYYTGTSREALDRLRRDLKTLLS